MRKIVQKNEVSIIKLSARRGLECRIFHHLSQTIGCKGHRVSFNLPATFQYPPATSKSIDIPVIPDVYCLCDQNIESVIDYWNKNSNKLYSRCQSMIRNNYI